MTDRPVPPPDQVKAPSEWSLLLSSITALSRVLQVFSISRLIVYAPSRLQATLRELYVLAWVVTLVAWLVRGPSLPMWVAIATTYRIVDILNYRLYFIFYKSIVRPWRTQGMRRSLTYAIINVVEIVVAFAILYLRSKSIGQVGGGVIGSSIDAVYFSATTMMTVGYGDFVPISELGRILVLCQFGCMALFLLLMLPLVLSAFSSLVKGEL